MGRIDLTQMFLVSTPTTWIFAGGCETGSSNQRSTEFRIQSTSVKDRFGNVNLKTKVFILTCRMVLNLENYATIFPLISHDSAMSAGILDTER